MPTRTVILAVAVTLPLKSDPPDLEEDIDSFLDSHSLNTQLVAVLDRDMPANNLNVEVFADQGLEPDPKLPKPLHERVT